MTSSSALCVEQSRVSAVKVGRMADLTRRGLTLHMDDRTQRSSDADEKRRRAAEARRLAAHLPNCFIRREFEDIARSWEQLARDREGLIAARSPQAVSRNANRTVTP